MRLFNSPRPGEVWEGLTTYTTDPHIGPPGYYALKDDGHTVDTSLRLTWVDEAPHDEEDGSGHFIVSLSSRKKDHPYYSHLPAHVDFHLVELESRVTGTSEVVAGGEDNE